MEYVRGGELLGRFAAERRLEEESISGSSSAPWSSITGFRFRVVRLAGAAEARRPFALPLWHSGLWD
ncbi:unnamed protein product [Cuscuta campestris]|uniref:Uncharacterized protein n=1 Tax=Cuscuta campestris TaxID=132261 RepID=A0A484MQY3_9ASTE|nr:unnamed protein product [Cuscuta campestris]